MAARAVVDDARQQQSNPRSIADVQPGLAGRERRSGNRRAARVVRTKLNTGDKTSIRLSSIYLFPDLGEFKYDAALALRNQTRFVQDKFGKSLFKLDLA